MGQILVYIGVGVLVVGLIILIYDTATYRKRQEKKIAEIEQDYK